MNQRQQGFSLIELMIAVAIIGVLAAVAMPAMRDYVIRSKVTGALLVADNVKTDLSVFYSVYGRFPIDADERALFEITPASGHPSIRQITLAGVGACNANAGCTKVRIQVMLQRAVYFGIDGDDHSQFVLAGSASGGVATWTCGPRDVQPFKLEWLPSTCRESII